MDASSSGAPPAASRGAQVLRLLKRLAKPLVLAILSAAEKHVGEDWHQARDEFGRWGR